MDTKDFMLEHNEMKARNKALRDKYDCHYNPMCVCESCGKRYRWVNRWYPSTTAMCEKCGIKEEPKIRRIMGHLEALRSPRS